ncbi:MAG: hypothetical protein IJZ44_07175 [Lachnospiraceae bacterium]|nr:hypothetical protein [Lachnospiraceae bacterium]
MSDDTVIFGYATRYYPVYWHNYLTSLYYMVGMSLFPASTGPIILQDMCLSLVFSFIYYKADKNFNHKCKHILLLCGLLPFVLLSALMCFRPVLYAPFFLFYFAYLYFEKKEQQPLTLCKLIFLALFTSILCFWRSEGIVLFVFSLILIPLSYQIPIRKIILFTVILAICFLTVRMPQVRGEKAYYGSDYLIVSTIRPLSLIIHREQTYEGAEDDWANINQIVDLDYLSYETLSCSSYNRYNSDYNAGRFSESGADAQTQSNYLKSALRLIAHNLDLYFAERLQLFFVTNGIYNYDDALVMGMRAVSTSSFHLYQSDKEYGYELIEGNKRIPITGHEQVAQVLFQCGGEAYLPILLLLFISTIYTGIRKKFFAFWALLSLIAREAVIFLTAPASFIQYSYPVMYVTVFFIFIFIIEKKEQQYNIINTKSTTERAFS